MYLIRVIPKSKRLRNSKPPYRETQAPIVPVDSSTGLL